MEELLRPVQGSKAVADSPFLVLEVSTRDVSTRKTSTLASPSDVLDALKNSPDLAALQAAVDYLSENKETLNIKSPSATTTRILLSFINDVVPSYWSQLSEDPSLAALRQSIIEILRSIPAVGSILFRLKSLITAYETPREIDIKFSGSTSSCLLSLLQIILEPDDFVAQVWKDVQTFKPQSGGSASTYRIMLWKDFVAMISSGRIISVSANVETVLQKSGDTIDSSWTSNGNRYTQWLARNLIQLLVNADGQPSNNSKPASELLSKALSLGYSDFLIDQILYLLSIHAKDPVVVLKLLLGNLKTFEQQSVLSSILRSLSSTISASTTDQWSLKDLKKTPKVITHTAGFLKQLVTGNNVLTESLIDALTRPESSTIMIEASFLRACIAALSGDEELVQALLEKSLAKFSDQLFIEHAPIVQQELISQVLLLSAGYVHRHAPMLLFTLARSSKNMNGISKRLSSKSLRARWLGMIVGMTISKLIDPQDSRMTFSDESMETAEGKCFQQLPYVKDNSADALDCKFLFHKKETLKSATVSAASLSFRGKGAVQHNFQTTKQGRKAPTKSMGKIIQLIEEDDDLIPYAKPDSDPEDDDEDPTLVNREKLRPPVYIRDLLSGLHEAENYERHHLALSSAAALIRRKSNFGTEVSDHDVELASTLVNLNDTFEMKDFLDLRQEALIAVLLAQPARIAQYLARILFDGEYSLQQRTSILTAIGLGARELAGYKDEERVVGAAFPSKQLPEHLHNMYSDSPSPLNKVSSRLEQSIVEPLALQAADSVSGPNALKIRTFSSRIAVEKARRKPIANALSKVVSENFFFPLTNRWWAAFGSQSASFSGLLLPTYLRTLALLLHASGPSTISLPRMTDEFWTLLLSIRTAALTDKDYGVLEALLFALLMLLEVNENKELLAREHSKELMETQEWARLVMDRLGSGDGEGERVRGLAASVIVRCHEVMERWHRLMVGDMAGY